MTFKTKSGSVYEVDYATSRVRRLSGTRPPTNSQGKDGEWRQYHAAFIELDCPAYFQGKQGEGKVTITTRVISMENSNA